MKNFEGIDLRKEKFKKRGVWKGKLIFW